ncbi:MAG: hypothetical protein OXJ55_05285 [Caldilineaceae bacterium]|nr:hypothetical protein [Caldilineaceae bacterium]MDE0464570.1 hypothetical protein [Caldilineaceae bacterium]
MSDTYRTYQLDPEKERKNRPNIDNVGKAIANDALVYYLIKQLDTHKDLPLVVHKITEMLKSDTVTIEKILMAYGLAETRAFDESPEVLDGFKEQLNHLKNWIVREEGNPKGNL